MAASTPDRIRRLYLDTLEASLTGCLQQDPPSTGGPFDAAVREDGRDWPAEACTMIGRKRMANVRMALETAIAEGIEGDFIETGVWRGGACIYARAILEAWGETSRLVWVADSFRGLPPPNPDRYPADAGDPHHTVDVLRVSLEQVKENFRRYGLLDERVRFLEGWFSETLPHAPVDRLAVLRLDGDMYESTMDALQALYHKVSPGGFVIVDDYGAVTACRKAVDDFRAARGIAEPMTPVDWTGVWWRTPGPALGAELDLAVRSRDLARREVTYWRHRHEAERRGWEAHLDRIRAAVDRLLATNRWTLGNRFVGLANRLRMRDERPAVLDELAGLLAGGPTPPAPAAGDGHADDRPLVREPGWAGRLGLSVAESMVRHQREIVFTGVSWMGVPTLKNVTDAWIYQEILHAVRPEVVVEIGSHAGGSTLFLCHMLDLLGGGEVVSVDVSRERFAVEHPRLVLVTGDSGSAAVIDAVRRRCVNRHTLVIHDGDHTRDAVLRDLRAYADLVTPGSYLVVEDGVVDLFDPVAAPELGWTEPGPLAAVRQFLASDDRFEPDRSCERYLATYNPLGFLRRVR